MGGSEGQRKRLLRDISTHWSLLKGPEREALDYLAETYGLAIHNYLVGILRRGDFRPLGPEDCDDLFQEFFLRLGRTGWLKKPDPSRGPFRQFFLGRLRYFLRERRAAALAQLKRCPPRSLHEIPDPPTPDPLQERLEKEWKKASIEATLHRIRRKNPARYDVLKMFLDHPDCTDAEIARKLGRSLHSYRSLLKRAREDFRKLYPVVEARLDGFGGGDP